VVAGTQQQQQQQLENAGDHEMTNAQAPVSPHKEGSSDKKRQICKFINSACKKSAGKSFDQLD